MFISFNHCIHLHDNFFKSTTTATINLQKFT
nr:MAG TPA: hypothetical protein [Caudoviricetes sp.]